MPDLPGGPSEAAIDAALLFTQPARRHKWPHGYGHERPDEPYGEWNKRVMAARLGAAHDPALGTDRSVNEAWCRADQTRRIVEWLVSTSAGRVAAAMVDLKFGGTDAD